MSAVVLAVTAGAALGQLALDRAVAARQARQQFQIEAYQLANELHGSSDRLTSSARFYVATRDRRFYDDYFDALEIRSGRRPRPTALAQISWGFFVPVRTGASSIPFEQMLENADFTRDERLLLLRAKAASDALSRQEIGAMRQMERLGYRPSAADEARSRQEALQTLFSPGYNLAKREVIGPLGRFDEMISQRLKDETQALEDRVQMLRYLTRGLAVLAIALALWGLWRTRAVYEARLARLGDACERVANFHDLTVRLPAECRAERAFNRLVAGQETAFRGLDAAAAELEQGVATLEAPPPTAGEEGAEVLEALKARVRKLRYTVLHYRF